MKSLTLIAAEAISGKYFKPNPELVKLGEGVSNLPHYIFIRGCVGVSTKKGVKEFLRGDLIYKNEGFWTLLDGQRFPFEKLGFYSEVPDKDLPWKNGEKWDSEAPWAGVTRDMIDNWVRYHEQPR